MLKIILKVYIVHFLTFFCYKCIKPYFIEVFFLEHLNPRPNYYHLVCPAKNFNVINKLFDFRTMCSEIHF